MFDNKAVKERDTCHRTSIDSGMRFRRTTSLPDLCRNVWTSPLAKLRSKQPEGMVCATSLCNTVSSGVIVSIIILSSYHGRDSLGLTHFLGEHDEAVTRDGGSATPAEGTTPSVIASAARSSSYRSLHIQLYM